MIKPGFIKKKVQKSRQSGKSVSFLSNFVLFIADRVLRYHYGSNYSTQCLQSSIAIKIILERFGIESQLWGEYVCVPEVFYNSQDVSWGGFWDNAHHIWLQTELGEVIDLSISQTHLHPARTRNDIIPMPAIWWKQKYWPSIIHYIPTARIIPSLIGEEKVDLDSFVKLVPDILDETMKNYDIEDITFGPILFGEESLNELVHQGNPWGVKTLTFQNNEIPLPLWVQNKLQENRN